MVLTGAAVVKLRQAALRLRHWARLSEVTGNQQQRMGLFL